MNRRQALFLGAALAHAAATSPASAAELLERNGRIGERYFDETRRVVIRQDLPGEPQREILLIEVSYPVGTGSPTHSHANGVMAFVVSGTIVSKVNDEPEQTFHAGDAWWEPPGATHRVSRNGSPTEPAKLLAIYIAPKNAAPSDLMRPL